MAEHNPPKDILAAGGACRKVRKVTTEIFFFKQKTAYEMHPMRAFGDKFGFVGLHISDDVPHDVGQIRQFLRFAVPLLNIVLAEITLSGSVNFADAV